MAEASTVAVAGLDPRALRNRDSTQFTSKLTFAQRCEIAAFYHAGVSVPVLAEAFGLHRRTVHHLTSMAANAKHYRDVREEYLGQGHAEFIRLYATEEGAAKVNAVVAAKPEIVAATETEYREHRSTAVEHPNKRRNNKAGHHRNEEWGVTFEVAWKDGELDEEGKPFVAGWYYAEDGGIWQGDEGGIPFNTSKAAHDKAMGK